MGLSRTVGVGRFLLKCFLFVILLMFAFKTWAQEARFPSWSVGVRGHLTQTKIDFNNSVLSSATVSGDPELINVGVFGQKEFFQEKRFSGTLLAFVGWNLGSQSDGGKIEFSGLRYGGEISGNVNFHYRGLRIQPLLGVGFSLGDDEIQTATENNILINTRVSALVGCRFLDRYENLMSSIQLGYRLSQFGGVSVNGQEGDFSQSGIEYMPLTLSLNIGYLF